MVEIALKPPGTRGLSLTQATISSRTAGERR